MHNSNNRMCNSVCESYQTKSHTNFSKPRIVTFILFKLNENKKQHWDCFKNVQIICVHANYK